jgi:hypothetical protein
MVTKPLLQLRCSVALGLLCVALGAAAQSRILGACDIAFEAGRFEGPGAAKWAIRSCDVRESIYQKWEAKLQRLDIGWRELSTARSAADWKAYRVKWSDLLQVMKELEAAALANRSVAGAEPLLSFYRADLGSRLHQAGFGQAANLDSASARIMAGLEVQRAEVAAYIGVEAVHESGTLGQWFALGLAAAESEKVVNAYRRQPR